MSGHTSRCDVCTEEPSVAIETMPGTGIHVHYGRQCLDANAHPWAVLVELTAILFGVEKPLPWVSTMILSTCRRLNRTHSQFNGDVAAVVERLRRGHLVHHGH